MERSEPLATSLAEQIALDDLPQEFARDIEASINAAVRFGATFEVLPTPSAIFRHALQGAIGAIESDARWNLFRRFLIQGPYDGDGAVPADAAGRYLSDAETGKAVRFLFYRVVNAFQGALAELLALGRVADIVSERTPRLWPARVRMVVGDALACRSSSSTWVKGPDITLMGAAGDANVYGVVEVKGYVRPRDLVVAQMDRHVARLAKGIRFRGLEPQSVLGAVVAPGLVRIGVSPATWRLPRTFRFVPSEGGRSLLVDPPAVPADAATTEEVDARTWWLTLRWSYEALASVAFDLTF